MSAKRIMEAACINASTHSGRLNANVVMVSNYPRMAESAYVSNLSNTITIFVLLVVNIDSGQQTTQLTLSCPTRRLN